MAELLDRYDLSLSDVEIRCSPCEQREYETYYKNRTPVEYCIGAIARFCDCKVWREKDEFGYSRIVYFGLRGDTEVAHYLTEVIDNAVHTELGRFKCTDAYQKVRYKQRTTASSSFAIGMAHSIGFKLLAMKEARDAANHSSGRDLVVLKASVVEAELARLNVELYETYNRSSRTLSQSAYDAGGAAGEALSLNMAIPTA